jgi:hypothetical protein
MSFGRTILGTCVAVIATAFASVAFAQCGGCGLVAVGGPVAVAPPVVAPVAVVQEVIQPVVAIPQVVPAVPIAPAPIAVDRWDTNGWGCGGGCGGCGGCGYRTAISPFYIVNQVYIVNQGPAYTGPGVMVPYGTYSAATGIAAPGAYPYIGSGRYYRPRYAYRHPYMAPYRYYPHRWRG